MSLSQIRQYRKVQCKAEEAALHSMRLQQQRLATTLMALPSSAALWQSLWLQLLVELQRLAQERKKAMVEMREYLLMHTVDLMMMERCWLDQTRTLVSIMPQALQDEEMRYDLSSYPPKIIPQLGVSRRPLMLITSTVTPPSTLMQMSPLDQARTGLLISTAITAPLPHLHDLICRILGTDLLPMPNSALPYTLTTRHSLSAILMA